MAELHLLISPAHIVVAQIDKDTLLGGRTLTNATVQISLHEIILRICINKHIDVRQEHHIIQVVIPEGDEELPEFREHLLGG